MHTATTPWDLLILDGHPPYPEMGSLLVADVDGDGRQELVIGSAGGLLWYRPATRERGVVAEGMFHVGLALADLDGDGRPEIIAGTTDQTKAICWYKMGRRLEDRWRQHMIDPDPAGGAHDVLPVDLDGDGRLELVANACGRQPFALFAYRSDGDPTRAWRRSTIQEGFFQEGLVAADLDGDGRVEIVSGPDLWVPPKGGPFSGPWQRRVLASGFREMVRVALVDITRSGRPDVVMAESEFYEGRASWFENRMAENPKQPWVEHPLMGGLYYAHSLDARRDGRTGAVTIFLAEMAEGGWSAPRNHDARLIELTSINGGRSWRQELLYQGCGTHQAVVADLDGDGELEIVGKQWRRPRVQVFKRRSSPQAPFRFRHRFLDRDKPATATDLLAVDVDGDGRTDIVCGRWWYRGDGSWQRRTIPNVGQVIAVHDLDGDGRPELVATRGEGMTADLVWLKAVDPLADSWQEHPIGKGSGDWPHGTCVAPLLPGGRLALVCGWHSADLRADIPELFEVPDDPAQPDWPRRALADIPYGEEIVAADLTGSGRLDLVAGSWWLENLGDGRFEPHRMIDGFHAARVCVADLNGDGLPDIILGEELLDFQSRLAPPARFVWLENPGSKGRDGPWPVHYIDTLRCPHSIGVADLDGDGQPEIICGEHDPFRPYRTRCRLLVYKKGDPGGLAWWRWTIDDRFEHHDGAKPLEIEPGRWAIASHGWRDNRYVHLWEA